MHLLPLINRSVTLYLIKASNSNNTWIRIYLNMQIFLRKYKTMVTCQIHMHFSPNAYSPNICLIIQFIVKFITPILFITALTCFYSNWNSWHNIEQCNSYSCFYGDLRGLLVTRSTNLACILFITTCRTRFLLNEITVAGQWDCRRNKLCYQFDIWSGPK